MALHVAMGIGDPERKRATSLRFLPSHPIPEVGRGRGADRAKEDKDEREEWWAAPGGKGGGISNLLGHVSSSHCFRLCLIPCGAVKSWLDPALERDGSHRLLCFVIRRFTSAYNSPSQVGSTIYTPDLVWATPFIQRGPATNECSTNEEGGRGWFA